MLGTRCNPNLANSMCGPLQDHDKIGTDAAARLHAAWRSMDGALTTPHIVFNVHHMGARLRL